MPNRLPPHAEIEDPRPAARAASQIIALINSRPVSPRQDEIEAIIAKALVGEIAQLGHHRFMRRSSASRTEYCEAFEIDDDPRVQERQAELSALGAQSPRPPRSFDDVIARAEIANLGADRERDDERIMVPHDDCFEGPAVRLVEAVLQFAGVYHG